MGGFGRGRGGMAQDMKFLNKVILLYFSIRNGRSLTPRSGTITRIGGEPGCHSGIAIQSRDIDMRCALQCRSVFAHCRPALRLLKLIFYISHNPFLGPASWVLPDALCLIALARAA